MTAASQILTAGEQTKKKQNKGKMGLRQMGIKIQNKPKMSDNSSHFQKPPDITYGEEPRAARFWFISRPAVFSPSMHLYNNVYGIVKRFEED